MTALEVSLHYVGFVGPVWVLRAGVLGLATLYGAWIADISATGIRHAVNPEQSYRNIFEHSTIGIFQSSPDGRLLVANPALAQICGYDTPEEMVREQGLIEHVYVDPNRRQEFLDMIEQNGWVKDFESEIHTKGGGTAWITETAQKVKDSQGKLLFFEGSIEDVTKRRHAQHELQLRNNYLATLHEVTLDLMGSLGTRDLILTIVAKAGELLGTPNAYVYMAELGEEYINMRVGLGVFQDFIGYKLLAGEGVAGKVWESGKVMVINDYDSWPERSPSFPDGLVHGVLAAPLRSGGKVVGVIGLARLDTGRQFTRDQIDLLGQFAELASIRLESVRLLEETKREVQQRRKVEQVVRESEEKFRSVAATASDAIITFSEAGQIVYLNPAAERLFGHRLDVIGRNVDLLFPKHYYNAKREGVSRFIPSQEAKLIGAAVELVGRHKDGSEFPIEATLAKWQSGDNTAESREYFTLIVRDISERKRIDQAKRDFVSLVSHQLKTPVALIRGYTDNLLSGVLGDMPERQRQYLKDIQEISAKNYNLITDLLNASRLERGVISFSPKPAKLSDIVRQAIRPNSQRIADKGLKLVVEGDDSVQVRLDMFKTAEAIGNVIDNAYKFTQKGQIGVRWGQAGNRAFVEVSDSGTGMSEETRKRLFRRDEPFSSELVPEPGAGLGLYIALEFITRQHGQIEVESTPGKGSKFTFWLPLVKVKAKGGR